jgi:site-specific recombinase XerD
MRVGEVLYLRNKDIDLRKKTITVRRGKGGKSRVIPINSSLLPILKGYKKKLKSGAEGILFPSKRSMTGHLTPQYVRQFIKKYCRIAGIKKEKLSPHVFRHGFATTLYQDMGVDLLRIATLLGHSSIRTTEIYSHTSESHLRSAIDKIKI